MTLDPDCADLLGTLPWGAYLLDQEWRFTYINPRAGQLFQQLSRRAHEELLGKNIWEECPEVADSTIAREFRRALAEQRAVGFEAFYPALRRWFSFQAGPYRGGVGVFFHDVSERKRLEDEVAGRGAVSDAEQGRHEFLAELAHELRNALAPVRNALHLVGGPATTAEVARARDLAESQVGRVSRLVDDLLRVSQLARGKVQPRMESTDLGAVVARAVEVALPAVEARGVNLTVDLPPERLGLEADPALLEEVIARLLDNAAKFTEKGGHVWVTAESEGGDRVLRVRDDGVGISAEMLPRVFDLFMRPRRPPDRRAGGVGTGLALVRGLVGLHGGAVEARSDGPGRGSEFVVRLPVLPPEPREKAAPPPAGGSPLRVLVVDDSAETAESLAVLLKLWGHEVRVTYDGETALEEARRQPPEVVLLDIGMPGLDGYEVARRLREQEGGATPVLIALTGYAEDEDRQRALDAGFEYHMVKPVNPPDLRELLVLAESLVRKATRPRRA